jgi:ATP-dependent Clp protease ATP-binding subunit ClpA
MSSTSQVDPGAEFGARGADEPTFARFTDRARRVVVLAQEDARLMGADFIGTEHLLLGLVHEGDGIAAKAIGQFGVTLESARELVEKINRPSAAPPDEPPPFTQRARQVLEFARLESAEFGQTYIATWHVLLGLLREGDGTGARVLSELGADLTKVRGQVLRLLETEEAAGEIAAPISEDWIASVVSKGLRPSDYEAAYGELSSIVASHGLDLEAVAPLDFVVRSVITTEGPGLEIRIRRGASPV